MKQVLIGLVVFLLAIAPALAVSVTSQVHVEGYGQVNAYTDIHTDKIRGVDEFYTRPLHNSKINITTSRVLENDTIQVVEEHKFNKANRKLVIEVVNNERIAQGITIHGSSNSKLAMEASEGYHSTSLTGEIYGTACLGYRLIDNSTAIHERTKYTGHFKIAYSNIIGSPATVEAVEGDWLSCP